jgi:hypothetical protein
MTDTQQYLAEQLDEKLNKYYAKRTCLMNAMVISMKPIIIKHINVFAEEGHTKGYIHIVHSYFDNMISILKQKYEYESNHKDKKTMYREMMEECCKECFKNLVLDNEYKNLKFVVFNLNLSHYMKTTKYYKIPFTKKLWTEYNAHEKVTCVYVNLNSYDTVISNNKIVMYSTDPLNTECIICNNNKKNAVLDSNCGHSFCYICLNALHNKQCPLCNKSFINIIKLY